MNIVVEEIYFWMPQPPGANTPKFNVYDENVIFSYNTCILFGHTIVYFTLLVGGSSCSYMMKQGSYKFESEHL